MPVGKSGCDPNLRNKRTKEGLSFVSNFVPSWSSTILRLVYARKTSDSIRAFRGRVRIDFMSEIARFVFPPCLTRSGLNFPRRSLRKVRTEISSCSRNSSLSVRTAISFARIRRVAGLEFSSVQSSAPMLGVLSIAITSVRGRIFCSIRNGWNTF